MPVTEFELITRFFSACGAERGDVELGVGDDAALLRVADGELLVAAVDTLVEGVHFSADAPPASIGHRALAVNLSDLAAMGAHPAWALLALTVPHAHEPWLCEFARGLCALASAHQVALVGGEAEAAGAAEIIEQSSEREGDDARARDVGVSSGSQSAGRIRASRK